MTISELVTILQTAKRQHGDLPVICTRCSDYAPVGPDDVSVIDVVPVRGSAGEWMTRVHPSMRPGERVTCLHFNGN